MMSRSSDLRRVVAAATGVLLMSGLAACTQQPDGEQAAAPPPATVTVTATPPPIPTRAPTSEPEPEPEPSETGSPDLPQLVLASATAFGYTDGVHGLGTVEPSEISWDTTTTGAVTGITWITWGSPSAVGFGTACYKPSADEAACFTQVAEVLASNIGTCDGQPAYENVRWLFPSLGWQASGFEASFIENCIYTGGD